MNIRRVSDLVHSSAGSWNVPLIRDNFLPHEATEILKLKAPQPGNQDKVRIGSSDLSHISAKQLYSLWTDDNMLRNPSSSSPENSLRVWKHLWKLKCQPKAKLFLWRWLRDALPIQDLVRRHHIPVNNISDCLFCDSAPETKSHLFFHCPPIKQAWGLLCITPPMLDLTDDILWWDSLRMPRKKEAALLLWGIWGLRNAILHSRPMPGSITGYLILEVRQRLCPTIQRSFHQLTGIFRSPQQQDFHADVLHTSS